MPTVWLRNGLYFKLKSSTLTTCNDEQNTPEMTLSIKKNYFDENLSEESGFTDDETVYETKNLEDQLLVDMSDRYGQSQDVIFRRKHLVDQKGLETESFQTTSVNQIFSIYFKIT